MSGIYASHATLYRDAGYWPRPIMPGTKACKIGGWQKPDTEIGQEELARWDRKYAGCGIGLVMGSPLPDGTTLGVLDVDRDEYRGVATKVLNGGICGRIGSKGIALFVRVLPGVKNRKFLAGAGQEARLVAEALFLKSLCVIPPTIHPDTKRPYRWFGKPLLEIDPVNLPLIGE